jgi:glycerate 2-kinase
VDGGTAERAGGLNAVQGALTTFDTYPCLERIGDAIITGPTGNNLRDLRVLLAY